MGGHPYVNQAVSQMPHSHRERRRLHAHGLLKVWPGVVLGLSDSVDSKLHGQPLVRLKISVRDTSKIFESDIVCDMILVIAQALLRQAECVNEVSKKILDMPPCLQSVLKCLLASQKL